MSVRDGRQKFKRGASFGLKVLLSALWLAILADGIKVMAHGGEDHGDEKPKTETTERGTILSTTRADDLEITLKHSPLEPDVAAAGKLFITRYATNEPVDAAGLHLTIESANGAATNIPFEKLASGGSYAVNFPAIPQGEYSIMVTLTVDGRTSTVGFPNVKVTYQAAAGDHGNGSWQEVLSAGAFLLIGASLFAGLVYFAVKVVRRETLREETASA